MQLSMIGQMAAISAVKTLEEEVVEQLRQAGKPLTCAELLARIPSAPDRETLSRTIFSMTRDGVIVRAGEVEAPPGTPRTTVACYILPIATPQTEGEVMPKNIIINPKKNTLGKTRDAILAAVAGIDRDHAISRDELFAKAPASCERGGLVNALKRLAGEATIVGAYGHTAARRYFDLRTLSAVCANSQTETEPAAETPQAAESSPVQSVVLSAIDQVRQFLASVSGDIKRSAVYRKLDLTETQIDSALFNLCKAGEVERAGYGVIRPLPGLKTVTVTSLAPGAFDARAKGKLEAVQKSVDEMQKSVSAAKPNTETVSEVPAVARAGVKQTEAASGQDDVALPKIEFSIYDDGRLAIIDGDEILVLPPDATRRLGRFLGYFEALAA